MDKARVASHFNAAMATYSANAVVQHRIADRLVQHMEACAFPKGSTIYEVGAGTGLLTGRVLERFQPKWLVANDLCETAEMPLTALSDCVTFLHGDAEVLPVPDGCANIVSSAVMQWFADVPAFLHKAAMRLSGGGFLAFSTFGPRHFGEIRAVSGVGLVYRRIADYRAMLETAGFEVRCAEASCEQLVFPHAAAVLRHVRETGTGGVAAGRWGVARTHRFCRDYHARFACAEGVTLTYHPLYVVAVGKGGR